MTNDKVKMVFMLSIVFFLWGSYEVGKSAYATLFWEKTDGFITDFERHSLSCGRGSSECYSLIVGFRVNDRHYYTNSREKFKDRPQRLEGQKVKVYYSASNPEKAVLGGAYSPADTGIIILIMSFVFFMVYFFSRQR